ncbi:MAG: dTDP-4-amino-4,6-dideoxygalactose transaminase [Glaciecola sp.]|jgi:dTDP-4-amino-4,6-dideoxygalactose transaminase
MITFNKPHLTGKEYEFIADAVDSKKISGNGKYTQLCHEFFETRYGFKKCLLTTSCTDALEMCALLLGIEPGDEVIMPSYTFVSTANPFILRGAKIVFSDSRSNHPGIDEGSVESLITSKTKAIVVVHYAGVACDMDQIMNIASKHDIFVVEDAAQAIESYYCGHDGVKRPLGTIGHLAAFSFHETKNIISGEGGLLIINDDRFVAQSEILWEKGTNRASFSRGEVAKYNWQSVGSSFLPSDIIAAFLYAQLLKIDDIQKKRLAIWNSYYDTLNKVLPSSNFSLPIIPASATNNAHMFYLILEDKTSRDNLCDYLKSKGVFAVFHYVKLHDSPFYKKKHDGRALINASKFETRLVRLPFYFDLNEDDISYIVKMIEQFFSESAA